MENREIKFRGKRVDNGGWVYGYLVKVNGQSYIIQPQDNIRSYIWHLIVPKTVGQYPGLKDKNGKEIYEGDIVVFGDKNIKQEVVFRKGQFMALQIGTVGSYIGLGYCDWEKHSEVIGNIYEDSKLLEATK